LIQSGAPPPADYVGFISVGEFFYLYGGKNSSTFFPQLYQLKANATAGVWTQISTNSGPSSRYGNGFVHMNGGLFVFAGLDSADTNPISYNDLFYFNLSTSYWSKVDTGGPILPQRAFMGVAASSSRMYVFGGYLTGPGVFYNDMYSLKPAPQASSWDWKNISGPVKGTRPAARLGHGFAAGDSGNIYAFGGIDYTASKYLNNLSVFNIMDMTWTNLVPSGSLPAPRAFMGFTVMREVIYVFGGFNNQGNLMFSVDCDRNLMNSVEQFI